MKAFINLLVVTDAYDGPLQVEDAVLALIEEDMVMKVIWSKSKEAKE